LLYNIYITKHYIQKGIILKRWLLFTALGLRYLDEYLIIDLL